MEITTNPGRDQRGSSKQPEPLNPAPVAPMIFNGNGGPFFSATRVSPTHSCTKTYSPFHE